MKHLKKFFLFENWIDEPGTITLFRGQAGHFFNDEELRGYQKSYNMLFLSNDINNAYFYTKPGYYDAREILVFEIPNNIARVQGIYIDRLGSDKIEQLKGEGYIGVTSNVGELSADEGEVGVFQNYKPTLRFQTTTGRFSKRDLTQLKKMGLSDFNIKGENML
jgi:hypothetical protein